MCFKSLGLPHILIVDYIGATKFCVKEEFVWDETLIYEAGSITKFYFRLFSFCFYFQGVFVSTKHLL